jgi:hypothetical protein
MRCCSSKGCGIVEYSDINSATRAITSMNRLELRGRPIYVREDRLLGNSGGSSGGNGGAVSKTSGGGSKTSSIGVSSSSVVASGDNVVATAEVVCVERPALSMGQQQQQVEQRVDTSAVAASSTLEHSTDGGAV